MFGISEAVLSAGNEANFLQTVKFQGIRIPEIDIFGGGLNLLELEGLNLRQQTAQTQSFVNFRYCILTIRKIGIIN